MIIVRYKIEFQNRMKIAIVNKSDSQGGAAVAAIRLHNSLLFSDIDSKVLVAEKRTDFSDVIQADWTQMAKLKLFVRFVAERLSFLPNEKNKNLRFAFSPANVGMEIHEHPLVLRSDVVHLHWFNQGFLSLKTLDKLLQLNKPVVWTLHDMWAFTGGCHYSGNCSHYTLGCGSCHLLRKPQTNDLSKKIFEKKLQIFGRAKNLHFITCSNWLKTEAQKSTLLQNFHIVHIPNPINTGVFKPQNKHETRLKLGLETDIPVLLFGAANIFDQRKGITYLLDALKTIKNAGYYKENQLSVILFGKAEQSLTENVGFPIHNFQYIESLEKIIDLYNAADVFLIPSLQDNLPNTLMEALSCGTPAVGFNIGGVSEMIDHKQNGYLANEKDAEDLANGIRWVLQNNLDNKLGIAARRKALNHYSYEVVAPRFIDFYKSILTSQPETNSL